MTTAGVGSNPDGFLPALAANVMGLETFAATTIEEWEAQIRGGVVTASAFLQTALNQLVAAADAATDQIAALLDGLFGTGHAIQDLVNYLQAIPGAVIDGITGIEQQIIDAIANALGHAGAGHTPADILGYLGLIPGANITGALNTAVTISGNALSTLFNSSGILASQLTGGINTAVTFGGTALSTLLGNLTSSGQFAASALTGALNTAVTVGGTALSTLIPGGQLAASQLTGAVNTAVTISGNALSTLFNSSGLIASQITGALNPAVTFLVGASNVSLSTLLQNLNATGQFAASQLTGALNGAVTFSGTALSTLLQYLNSSGQFAASQLTGGINTAVTFGGTALSTLLANINSSGQFLGSAITGAINTAATVAGQTLGTIQTNAQGLVNSINNAAAGLLSGASTALADATTNIQALFGSAPQYLQGLSSGVFGQSQTNAAYAAANAASAAQAAEQTRINSAFNAVFNVSPVTTGNVNQTIDFTAIANQSGMSGIMLPGTGTGSGYLGVTGGQAAWQGGTATGVGDIEVFPTVTTSDYQVITVTLGSLNDTPTTSPSNVWTYILARCNSARDAALVLRLKGNGTNLVVQIVYMVSGAQQLYSPDPAAVVSTAAAGGTLKWIIGDPSSSSPYAMQVLYNGTPIITFTDSSHLSQLGASYRYVGLGALVGSTSSGKYPTAIRSVTYQDNPPAPGSYPFSGLPTAGTKGRIYRCDDVGLELRDNGAAWEYVRGGPLAWFTPPPSSGWSTTTLGSATFAADLGGRKLSIPSSSPSDAWRIEYRTLSPSSNYTATAWLELAHSPGNYIRSGLVLMNNSGSFIDFGVHYDSSASGFYLTLTKWTNATTFGANYTTLTLAAAGGIPNWLRFRDDGSLRYAEYSFNGVDWILVYSVSRTDFITPTRIGWGSSNISGNSAVMRLRSLAGVS